MQNIEILSTHAYRQRLKYQIAIIREWFIACLYKLDNPRYQAGLEKACLVIYNFQTSTEKLNYETKELNNFGFNGRDAKFGTAMAQRILKIRAGELEYQSLSPKMYTALHRMLKKYSRQLAVSYLNKETQVPDIPVVF